MKINLQETGTVLSYNNDPNKQTPYKADAGSKIEWKRNGVSGCARAKILGFSDEKPKHVYIENYLYDWSRPIEYRARVWIKKRSILKVLPD